MDARRNQPRSESATPKNRANLLRWLTKFNRNQTGAIAIMVAMMLPILIGMVGLGVETAFWYHSRRDLQSAADAAAIAGAYEIKRGSSESEMDTASLIEAQRNGFVLTDADSFKGEYPPLLGAYTTNAAYEVTLVEDRELLFASMFLDNAVTISVRAVATVASGPDDSCILTLEETDSSASWISGTATATLEGCTLYSNSSATNSIRVTNNAQLTAECVITAGGIDGTIDSDEEEGNIILVGDDCVPIEGGQRATDPYAAKFASGGELEIPDTSAMPCLSFGDAVTEYQTGGTPVPGGLYCSDLGNWGGDVQFAEGATIFIDGNLNINSGSTVTGSDVTLIAVDHDGDGDYGTMDINGGATVTLSAKDADYGGGDGSPGYGQYTGFIFIVDPNAPEANNTDSKFNGGSTMELTGMIYSPTRSIEFTGGNVTESPCLKVVADTIKFGGDSIFGNTDCDAAGVGEMLLNKVVGLVE